MKGKVLDIKCPNPSCGAELSYECIADVVDAPLLEKFEQFSLLMTLRTVRLFLSFFPSFLLSFYFFFIVLFDFCLSH